MKRFDKVLTAEETSQIEKSAIAAGSNPEMFMLEAGKKVALQAKHWIAQTNSPKRIALLIGKGNNGGDAWAAGAWLLEEGYDVSAYPIYDPSECTPLNQKMMHLFMQKKGVIEKHLRFEEQSLILDGLLGTGFKGKLDPKIAHAIDSANLSKKPILAIDIPSGLDGTSGEIRGTAIQAAETIALGSAKSGFFLRDGWNCVGKLKVEDFGLPSECLDKAECFAWIPSEAALNELLPPIVRNRHKYQAGYVLGFGGSKKLPGAIKLSGMSALRTGSGIVRIFSQEEIGEIPLELIFNSWNEKEWETELERAQAVFVGPGLGHSKEAAAWLKQILPSIDKKCVVDADALHSKQKFPKDAILTPHKGEALRLLNLNEIPSDIELIDRCQSFCAKENVILVLKGAPTYVLSEKYRVVIPYGDPGMATAGSGDVLTGILAFLLSQGMEPFRAAILGASLHGMAGEAVSAERGSYGMIASDLIAYLHQAFLRIAR